MTQTQKQEVTYALEVLNKILETCDKDSRDYVEKHGLDDGTMYAYRSGLLKGAIGSAILSLKIATK